MDQPGEVENTQTRKRTRDQGEDNKESKKGKESEFSLLDDVMHKEKSYDFRDGLGVFDFPWLKEGVIYKGNEYFEEPEDTFAPCHYTDEEVSSTFASNLDQSCARNLLVPPTLEPEDTFAPCHYTDEEVSSTFTSNLDQLCAQNLLVPPTLDQNLHCKKSNDDSLRLLSQVEDLEPVDCIWSFAIDQPLDVGLNKARLEIR